MSAGKRWLSMIVRRWPIAVGIASVVAFSGGGVSDDGVAGLGEALLLLPLGYLVLAKIRRRNAAWLVLFAGLAAIVALRAIDVVAPSAFLSAVALVVLVWGAADGQLRKPDMFRVQAWGMLGFGALALAGLAVEPELARYIVAAGWFFHGIWDYVHLRLDKVVSRSYAEWCAAVDIVVAVQLVMMA